MLFAIECYFEEQADAAVRTSWGALERRGVRSAASGPVPRAGPYVSLSVFDSGPLANIETVVASPLQACRVLLGR